MEDFLRDAYAQTRAGNLAGSIRPVKSLADARKLLRRHADAVVGNADAGPHREVAVPRHQLQIDRHAAAGGEYL